MRKTLLTVLAGLVLTAGMLSCAKENRPPNLVLLFADDLGYGDLGCFGHPTIRTPNLDRMAEEGIKLTSFYAAPSCTPSRVALMTGRYPPRTGLPRNLGPDSTHGLPTSEILLAETLKTRNYRTIALGKWHLGHHEEKYLPTSNGFDSYFGLLYSNDMQPPWVQTEAPLKLFENTDPVEYPVDQTTLTKRYTRRALEFIRASKGAPFFVYLAYSMVHVPVYASEEFAGKSSRGAYGDAVEEIDWSAGQILEAVRQEGLEDNTLVVFTSDNGPWLHMPDRMFRRDLVKQWDAGSTGLLRGWKANTYEGGVRVPFLARWPGRIPARRVSAQMACTMDLYTTFLNLAGAEVPTDRVVDGQNIMPFLEGSADSPRDTFYYFRGADLEAIRQGKWKLRLSNHLREDVPPDQPPSPELFDLELDPSEMYNLADEHPEIVERLRPEMERVTGEIRAGS